MFTNLNWVFQFHFQNNCIYPASRRPYNLPRKVDKIEGTSAQRVNCIKKINWWMLMRTMITGELVTRIINKKSTSIHNWLFTLALNINDVISWFTLTCVRSRKINTHGAMKTRFIIWSAFINICQEIKRLSRDQHSAYVEKGFLPQLLLKSPLVSPTLSPGLLSIHFQMEKL